MKTPKPPKQKESLVDWITRTTPPQQPNTPTVKKPANLPTGLPRLVPLDAWGKLLMGEHAPHINTLRTWAKEGRIQPQPVKIGKRWFVKPDAQYVSD